MLRLGLTGGIGSGKSAAAGIFKSLGAYIVDADKISRDILTPGTEAYRETVARFGKEILNPDRTVDRKALAAIVFGSKTELEALNNITHKHIFAVMEREARDAETSEKYKNSIIVIDAPLLFAPDFKMRYDKSAAVIADNEVRIERVLKRDEASRAEVESRIGSQLTNAELAARADYIIENNSNDIKDFENKVKKLYERLI